MSVKNMLKMYIGKRQQSWAKWLYWIQFTYIQRDDSTIGKSPFTFLTLKNVEPLYLYQLLTPKSRV